MEGASHCLSMKSILYKTTGRAPDRAWVSRYGTGVGRPAGGMVMESPGRRLFRLRPGFAALRALTGRPYIRATTAGVSPARTRCVRLCGLDCAWVVEGSGGTSCPAARV